MYWKSEPPVENGFYWIKNVAQCELAVVHVFHGQYFHFNSNIAYDLDDKYTKTFVLWGEQVKTPPIEG